MCALPHTAVREDRRLERRPGAWVAGPRPTPGADLGVSGRSVRVTPDCSVLPRNNPWLLLLLGWTLALMASLLRRAGRGAEEEERVARDLGGGKLGEFFTCSSSRFLTSSVLFACFCMATKEGGGVSWWRCDLAHRCVAKFNWTGRT